MWPNKVRAVVNIEQSLFNDRPRSLIQMATRSGKTLLAVTTLYRLIKFGGARRVLFLVDRANLISSKAAVLANEASFRLLEAV